MHTTIITLLLLWLLRLLVVAEVGTGIIGLLWFSDYYFSLKNPWDTVTAVAPLLAMITGAFAPAKLITSSNGFRILTLALISGSISVASNIYGDLTIINGPDYGPLKARFLDLFLINVFALRALRLKRNCQY